MTAAILSLCCFGLGVREAIACAKAGCPVCYLLELWQEQGEESSNG